MLRDSFNDLASEFNTAAQKAVATDTTPNLLLTRYSAILRYKSQSTDEKEAITAALFKTGLDMLHSFAPPATQEPTISDARRSHASNAKGHTQMIFSRLLEPDSLPYLPESAAEQLADATLALARRLEAVSRDNFINNYYAENQTQEYKKCLRELAEQALTFADKLSALKAATTTAGVIGQKIAPAAKIQLRQPENN